MCFYEITDISPIPSTARYYMCTSEEPRQLGNHAQQNARHRILSLGTIKQVYKLRINKRKISNDHRKVYKQNGINHKKSNLCKIHEQQWH